MTDVACTGSGGRGCSCVYHAARRPINREYAKRQRDRALAARNAEAGRCQRRAGPGICNSRLETTTGTLGETIVSCPMCERRKAGICRDCSRPVEGTIGKAMRCTEHKEIARLAAVKASQVRHYAKRLAGSRKYYQENPEIRRQRNEYKKAYRKANPEKVREQKRREALRQGKKRLAWHRRHNRKLARALRKRQMATLAYYRENPTRPVPVCAGCARYLDWTPLPGGRRGAPPKWCDSCAPKAEQQRRARTGRTITTCDEPPAIAYMPPLRELEQKFGPRTCVTADCDIVVTGRKKKCTKCKERDAEEARQILAPKAHKKPRTQRQVTVGVASTPAPSRRVLRDEVTAVANPELDWWAEHVDRRELTIQQLAAEAQITEHLVTEKLRSLGGDLLAREQRNALTAEKKRRAPRLEWWTSTTTEAKSA